MSEKNIKDYLHLYLGCEVILDRGNIMQGFGGGVGRMTLEMNTPTILDENILWCISHNWPFYSKHIKLILRPLSDMTEEEMHECGNLDYDFSTEPELNTWTSWDFDCLLTPTQFHWLLSKHFDLFGLIEAGLAIDKTILP